MLALRLTTTARSVVRRGPALLSALAGRRPTYSTDSTPLPPPPPPPPSATTAKDSHSHEHHDPLAPQSESLGKGFWAIIAGVVGVLSVYKFTTTTTGSTASDNMITRAIQRYHSRNEVWDQRNAVHTAMVEQAAIDRTLFQDSKRKQVVGIMFPEVLNNGAPWNQEAGWASGDLSAVKATMEARRERIAEQVREKMARSAVASENSKQQV